MREKTVDLFETSKSNGCIRADSVLWVSNCHLDEMRSSSSMLHLKGN